LTSKKRVWRPQPKQELLLSLPYFEVLFGGAKGPGKSESLLAEGTRQRRNPNYKGIIFRRTFPALQDLIDRSHKWFSGSSAAWNGEKHRWTWSSRAKLIFAHCKNERDKYSHQGQEYQFMGFDQLEQFTETQYLFLMAQCRTSDSSLKCYIRSTANPGGVGHTWVKRRFINACPMDGSPRYFKRVQDEDVETTKEDPMALSRAFVFATVYDNPILMKNDPSYLIRLMALPEKLRQALLEGNWDVFEGQFFREWDREVHVIPEFDRNQQHNTFIAMDYGYSKPSSVGWYAVLPNGYIRRYREFYKEGYSYEALARKILEINQITNEQKIQYLLADPAIWGDKQHHEQHVEAKDGEVKGSSGFQTMQDVIGTRFPVLKADNRRIVGWGKVHEFLAPFMDPGGRQVANFAVTQSCRQFIRTFPGLIHDEIRPEDVDTDGEDHCGDEVRYALMSRPILPKVPVVVMSPGEEFWDRVEKDKKRIEAARTGEEYVETEETILTA